MPAVATVVDRVRAAEPVVFAVAGRPIVIPVLPEGGDAAGLWIPVKPPTLSFITGEAIESSMVWISGRPAGGGGAEWLDWLPPTLEWSALTPEEVRAARGNGAGVGEADPLSAGGFWAVYAVLPPRAADRELRLDGRPMRVTWLPEPPRTTDVGRAPRPRATPEAARALGDMLRAEDADPLRRWRVRLILDRWSAKQVWDAPAPPRLDEPALEALAQQNEWRWRAAISRLASSGADTAADVLARLTAVVAVPGDRGVGDGVSSRLLPAWPLDEASASRLRAVLLDPARDDDDRLDAARAWLASTPSAVAWVADDGPIVPTAGAEDGRSAESRRVRVAISDLSGRRTPAGAAAERDRANTSPLEGHETRLATIELPIGGRTVEPIRVQAGRWTHRVLARAAPFTASPPGLAIGPLLPAWRLDSWLAGNPGAQDPAWTTGGLLQRSASGDGWEVYVECRFDAARTDLSGDRVRLMWGAPGDSPGAAGAERLIEVKAPPRDQAQEDRWTATVPLPDSAIEAGGTLRLSMERIDARGARSSWPRPLMPGDAEPPRGVIDTGGWTEPSRE